MAKALAAARSGFRRLFSISAFTPPPAAAPPPKADPSPNLFVSGLSKRTSTEGLREAFSKFGEVVHAKVVTDRVSGYSKGFGFVRYASTEDANEGIKGMDGKFLDGWVIFAEYARPRPPIPSLDQSSQPLSNYGSSTQSNYGSAPQSNYSSPTSHSPSYYTSDTTSNFSSQTSHPPSTQPPSSDFYNVPQTSQPPQSSYYGGTTPSSNYTSQTLQPESNYAPNYFGNSSQQSQTSSAAPPSWYPSQTTPPEGYQSGTPNYSQSYYGSAPTPNQFSQPSEQPFNYLSQTSDPASGYNSNASNYSPHKSEIPPENASSRNVETYEASTSYSSEPQSEYDSGKAVNY